MGEEVEEKTFGEFIADHRKMKEVSVTDLSEKVGCTSPFIRNIERGAQNPSTATARKILSHLAIDYEEIDSHTLKVKRGPIFRFNTAIQGQTRGGKPRSLSYIARVVALEARVAELEKKLASQRKPAL